jgi:hypothetical protein
MMMHARLSNLKLKQAEKIPPTSPAPFPPDLGFDSLGGFFRRTSSMLFFPEKALIGLEARARFLMERAEEGMDEPARDLLAAVDGVQSIASSSDALGSQPSSFPAMMITPVSTHTIIEMELTETS